MQADLSATAPTLVRWAAVSTHPAREHVAIENLQRQDFECYCPMMTKRVRHARRTQELLRPFFPGYVFVGIDPGEQRWRPILSTIGVRTIVRCGDEPSLLDQIFIDALREREVDGAIARPALPYRVGQQVRLTSGALDGLVATIVEMHEKDRLVVLLDLLRRPVRVTLQSSRVAEIGGQPPK
ncbi:MAG: transcriptional activator RfaH [Hyphomicrobiaceae bacterium]|nr:transcriptional activator RfaH [Hyphomicrobiaceae bacterium]